MFKPIVGSLKYHDPFMLLADYQAYLECQDEAEQVYRHPEQWTKMSILNVARCGYFSSDRAIRQYCEDIWQVKPSEHFR